jgi:hypothetical protein
MTTTTRQYLRARVLRYQLYTLPVLLAIVISAILSRFRHDTLLLVCMLLAMAVYITSLFIYMWPTPCLRCSAPLRKAALNWGYPRGGRASGPTQCASCGLGLDEEVDGPANPQREQS